MNIKTSAPFVLCALLLAGCATNSEMANTSTEPVTSSSQTSSDPAGRANIFVHRDGQLSGASLTLTVYFDGATAGPLMMGNSMDIQASPGEHLLGISVGVMTRMTAISVAAGHNYFYRFHAGLTRLKDPEPVSESDGQSWSSSSSLKSVYQATTTSEVARLKKQGGTLTTADAINVLQTFLSGGTQKGFTWDKATVTEEGISLHLTAGIFGNGIAPSQASGSAQTGSHLAVDAIGDVTRKKEFFLHFADVARIKTETTLINGDYLLFYDSKDSELLSIPCGVKFSNFDLLLSA